VILKSVYRLTLNVATEEELSIDQELALLDKFALATSAIADNPRLFAMSKPVAAIPGALSSATAHRMADGDLNLTFYAALEIREAFGSSTKKLIKRLGACSEAPLKDVYVIPVAIEDDRVIFRVNGDLVLREKVE
jgi:hypothetical protein